MKRCPTCGLTLAVSSRQCPDCGFEWTTAVAGAGSTPTAPPRRVFKGWVPLFVGCGVLGFGAYSAVTIRAAVARRDQEETEKLLARQRAEIALGVGRSHAVAAARVRAQEETTRRQGLAEQARIEQIRINERANDPDYDRRGPKPQYRPGVLLPSIKAYLDKAMHDPSSLKVVEDTDFVKSGDTWAQAITLRAKNGFGATVVQSVVIRVRGAEVASVEGFEDFLKRR
jgi:hypothetical protein